MTSPPGGCKFTLFFSLSTFLNGCIINLAFKSRCGAFGNFKTWTHSAQYSQILLSAGATAGQSQPVPMLVFFHIELELLNRHTQQNTQETQQAKVQFCIPLFINKLGMLYLRAGVGMEKEYGEGY